MEPINRILSTLLKLDNKSSNNYFILVKIQNVIFVKAVSNLCEQVVRKTSHKKVLPNTVFMFLTFLIAMFTKLSFHDKDISNTFLQSVASFFTG